ncbi:MAG: hypothetical protein GY716_00450 [bacterium]|nr:hypothetical protein [bacterium]
MKIGWHTVLIVSDAQAASDIQPTFLEQPDIRLLSSSAPRDALDVAQRERPALIIEDLSNSNGESLNLCRKLKTDSLTRGIPLILVTDREQRRAARRAGPDIVLEKPLVQRDYFEAVQRYVPLPKRRDQRVNANLRFIYSADGMAGQAFSRDVSQFGAFLKTDRVLRHGTDITLRFSLPGDSQEICCKAVVRRSCVEAAITGGRNGFGIEFEEIDDPDMDRLQNFIRRNRRRFRFFG